MRWKGSAAVLAARRRRALAAGKKNATRWQAHLVFVDESGFLLIPTLRRAT